MLSIIKKEHEFIVEEKDVTIVLEHINEHRNKHDVLIGNCGWEDTPDKWFIIFEVRDKVYGQIVKDLLEIGEFKLDVRPGGQVDLCFERA